MAFYLAQFLSGLASAASLFLIASGLSVIFGVTRIVNFAHGGFAMLGAYIAYTLTERLSGPFGFWGGLLAAALATAFIGALVEIVLLRRIYRAPELFQLLATFGVSLMLEDIVVLIWGPDDLVGPRAPGLHGALRVFGEPVPTYDIFLIVCVPVVLGLIWLALHKTRWGVLVRAATQDREMVSALGVNQKWLFTSVFAIGIFLAALGGVVQIPRDAVTHTMDINIIVEVFVVVVIGGLGSVFGAFVAAVLVSEINAFAILAFPKISLILIFAVMAVVLTLRPWGLFGKPEAATRQPTLFNRKLWAPLSTLGRGGFALVFVAALVLPLIGGNYVLGVGAEILIFIIFAVSLHLIMSVGGLASFGHAAYFGLGAYGAALGVKLLGLPMLAALVLGPLVGLLGALAFGWFCVRLSGVYFAMLTLAFAQIVWSIAFQWVEVTGGDNGILGVWPAAWAASPAHFYLLTLAVCAIAIAAHRTIVFAPFGYGLRAARDSALRGEAIGIGRISIQWAAFVVSGLFAAIAGALFVFLKGSVFTDSLNVPLSIDGLVMVLLGGIETVSGAIVGAIAYKALQIWLMSKTDLSKLVLGTIIVVSVVVFPRGIVGTLEALPWRRAGRSKATLAALAPSNLDAG
jgi:branched-chain amino acid transport system permease protein